MVKKSSKNLYRILSWILVLLMIVSVLPVISLTTNAAETIKVKKSYEIAIVFDNSGSMYEGQAWCRAKYAMEIFASMLNYENGDRLRIYPMWEVTTDGSQPGSGGNYTAIEVGNKKDIDQISKLYTVNPSATPFAPILEAHEYLKDSKATEKWIIVLTDGEFNRIERERRVPTIQGEELKSRLLSVATNDIKVQYLGFDKASELSSEEAQGFFAKKSSDTSLKDDLIGICNGIFQRSVLPNNYLSGTTLNLDMSMKSLIVFAQGSNAKITSLVDESGKEIKIALDSGQRKYSDIKAKGYENARIDETLAGQVVTFTECSKGKYTLNYSGADAIQIFYEPNVDIKVSLKNNDGEVVDGSSEDVTAGEYTINSMLVDGKTGEDITNHELMGKDVKLTTRVKTSKDSEYKEYENGSKITLSPDPSTDIIIVGTYLKDYTITSEGNSDLSWLTDINIKEPSVDFKIDAEVLQPQSWFTIRNHKKWKPIKVSMTIDGQALTDEQLVNTKLSIETMGDLQCRYESIPGESAYNVYIAQDKNGKYVEPKTGRYKLKAIATYTDEYGEKSTNTDEVSFEIQRYSKIWRILVWIFGFLCLFFLWLMFMLKKVLPKEIRKDSASFHSASAGDFDASSVKVEYRRKGKSLTVTGPSSVDFDEQCSATYNLRAVDNRFTKSRKRRIAVIGIESVCEEMRIAGTPYVNYNGQWIKRNELRAAEEGRAVSPIDQELSCNPRFEFGRANGLATLTCRTKTIK